jgi:hypothetical protein
MTRSDTQKFFKVANEIHKLAAQIPHPEKIVFTPNISETQKKRYIILPDGSLETRKHPQ